MGRTSFTLFLLLILSLCPGFLRGQDLGTHAKIRSFTMPQYHEKNNRLQFIVYGKRADNKGALLFLDDLVVDFMRNDLDDVNDVKMLQSVEPYSMTAPYRDILSFWKDKTHSQGIIFSEAAELDKNVKILRSDKPVQFRSSFLDVDGVGFDAYQKEKHLHIRSKVRVHLRPEKRKEKQADKPYRSAADYLKEDLEQKN